jgi:hypothetical protein
MEEHLSHESYQRFMHTAKPLNHYMEEEWSSQQFPAVCRRKSFHCLHERITGYSTSPRILVAA